MTERVGNIKMNRGRMAMNLIAWRARRIAYQRNVAG